MSAYSILAKYYDRLMGDFDYKGYLKFVENDLKGEGVDLACGSGEMTIALAKAIIPNTTTSTHQSALA